MKVKIDDDKKVWFIGLDNMWHSYGKEDKYMSYKIVKDDVYQIQINGKKIPVDRETLDDFHHVTTWN